MTTLFLTGVTGFLGKVVLEELARLRHEGKIPTHKIILLIREKKGFTIRQRFDKLANSLCFSKLDEKWSSNIQLINGNVEEPLCGLDAATYTTISNQITHIIHCAASIDFTLPIAQACSANIDGTLNILDLAKSCPNLQRFIDTSTAYVTPPTTSTITESLWPLPEPAEKLYQAIKNNHITEREMLEICGHPNTYTLTKCISEHLVAERAGHVPVTIVRPSIISASWQYPFPGWIDSRAAFGGFISLFGTGFLQVMEGSMGATFDVIPVDSVAQRLIDECRLVPSSYTPPAHHIVHSAAGLNRAFPATECVRLCVANFKDKVVMRPARWRYLGPKGLKYYYHKSIAQSLPLYLATLLYKAQGNAAMLKKVMTLRRAIKAAGVVFPVFCTNTYDFVNDQKIADDYTPEAYLKLICDGVHRHLLLNEM